MAGPVMNAACLTYEGINFEVETFPPTKDDVWVLGKHYNIEEGDLPFLNRDIRSRLWFTYRKNFPNIGGTGPTADSGWGCMLRCGQMMLAQALLCRHLGRDWQWDPDKPKDSKYLQVLLASFAAVLSLVMQCLGRKHCVMRLRMAAKEAKILQAFLDKKDSLYSLHQIAQMGVSEGKPVGSWFGPNTVVQVLKKLSLFDDWSSVCVHVAMDNTIIIEDIKILCKQDVPRKSCGESTCYDCTDSAPIGEAVRRRGASSKSPKKTSKPPTHSCKTTWRPLVLFVPLRLGLSEMNPVYNDSLKACFKLRQSIGVLGGKPNHATYFIGYYGNNLLYLDPHTTQQTVYPEQMSQIPDGTYHCVYPCRMAINEVDPSVAIGFFCKNEEDFDDLCEKFQKTIINGKKRPMFELAVKRPPHWPVLEIHPRPSEDLNTSCQSDFTVLTYEEERKYDTDEEYEIL